MRGEGSIHYRAASMSTHDLGAFVINLRVTRPLSIRQHMGRAGQQLCLAIMQDVDPLLSEEQHRPNQTKAYSVSGLLRPDDDMPVWGDVTYEDRAWLRLVGLRADVVQALAHFAQNPPTTIEIDRDRWHIESVIAEQHHWAGQASYALLVREHQQIVPPSKIELVFAAPTSFHRDGLNIPVAEPSLVWGSLLRQWNYLSGFPLPETLTAFIRWHVMLSRYRAETQILNFKQGSQQIGFVGQAAYTIKTRSEALEKADPALDETLQRQHADLARSLALLAAFTFYSGIGIKTTTGMGMVRPLQPN